MWHPLLWKDGSGVYKCCWPSPVHSFLRPSPAGLMTTFYCLRFETPPTWRPGPHIYIPPEMGGPSYTPTHWVPFPSPFTTRRATVKVIRTRLHTLECQCAIPWQINSRRAKLKLCPQQCLHFLPSYLLPRRHELVKSRVTVDGQSASLPRNKAPIWGPRPDFHHCQKVVGRPIRGAPSPTRGWVRRLQPLPVLASAVNLGSESRGTRDHTPPSQIRDFPLRRLPRLAGPRWRHSPPPPHGISNIHYFFKLWALHVTFLLVYHFSCLITMTIEDFWRSCYMCTPLK
jgi:hypothetical protein